MRLWKEFASPVYCLLLGVAMLGVLGLTGCQSCPNGQTLPSPWYMTDDIQYFPPGLEQPLPNETAHMKAQAAEAALR